jgi:hypothetical protein
LAAFRHNRDAATMKHPIALTRVLILCAPALLLGACVQPAPAGGVTAEQAMARANEAYALAQKAEADAQAARSAASSMYQRSLYK